MNTVITNILRALQNPHLSLPLLAAVALEVIPIWFPGHKEQFAETQKVLLMYGVIAAANSGPAAAKPSDKAAP